MGCWPLSIPLQTLKRCLSSTKFISGVLVCSFFIHLEKENDDVTKMKFVNLWGWVFFVDFALNDIIDARSKVNAPSLSNAPPYVFRPLRPLCNKRPCLK